jgi:hypothetical protein
MASAEVHAGELVDDHEFERVESSSTLMALNSSEIDTQISTAKRYPRSITQFMKDAKEMVSLTEDIAGDCIYALPRDGKSIEGPSARFAEILISAWGNCRAGARVVSEDERFVNSQGVFLDLQHNTAITYEVKRRITNKHGKKFKDDMIGVTSNAACSIALRNAVLKGIPKAYWRPIYELARKTAIGDVTTLATRRKAVLDEFGKMGVVPDMIYSKLGVAGFNDITLDHLGFLRGIFTALREGDTTIEQVFSSDDGAQVPAKNLNDLANRLAGKRNGKSTDGVDPPHSDRDAIQDERSESNPSAPTREEQAEMEAAASGRTGKGKQRTAFDTSPPHSQVGQ